MNIISYTLTTTADEGNFREIMTQIYSNRSVRSKILKVVLHISKTTQNDLILIREIVMKVKDATLYSISFRETTGINKISQMFLSV